MGEYREALQHRGLAVPLPDVRRGYEAGLVARATRLVTTLDASEERRSHGTALLQWASKNASDRTLRRVAARILEAWIKRRAAGNSEIVSDGRRRHLSRAMAYHLRHGEDVNLDRSGWAYVAAVSDSLYRDGLATDKAELLLVAEAVDETRFEVSGPKVRATYGHSRSVTIDRERSALGTVLYHGTATANLDAILEQRQGLNRMNRGWVHMSSDVADAERAARRHGAFTMLRFRVEADDEAYHAAGATHLLEAVPADRLAVVTPSSLMFLAAPPLEIRSPQPD